MEPDWLGGLKVLVTTVMEMPPWPAVEGGEEEERRCRRVRAKMATEETETRGKGKSGYV